MIGVVAALAAGGLAAAVVRGIFAPRSGLFCRVVSSGSVDGPARVALTFDDGPWPGSTDAVLSTLDRLGVHAAFFVIGTHARRHPEILRRIDAAGHIIGNHSHQHRHWGAIRHRTYWRHELDDASAAIADAIGRRPLLFRPPLGQKNPFMAIAARERRLLMVTWSNRAVDGVPTTTDRILARVLSRARAGQIIALHDGVDPHRDRDPGPTVAAIEPLICGLRSRGLSCERLDRLIGLPAYAVPAAAEGALSQTQTQPASAQSP